jgi:hypothetical protein
MTAYWPTSAVAQRLEPGQRAELASPQLGMSMFTMAACHLVTSKIPACTALVVICSKGAGVRRVYLNHPDYEQWVALERGGFVEMWDDFGFVMDALH